jgi:hypothetical protein
MNQFVTNYCQLFRDKLDCAQDFKDALRFRRAAASPALIKAAEKIGDVDPQYADGSLQAEFLNFLRGEGDATAIVMRVHAGALARFDAIGTAEAEALKQLGRRMIEAEYAIWHAHKKLLDLGYQDLEAYTHVVDSSEMRGLLDHPGGAGLFKQLAFAGIWQEIHPQH